MIKDKALSQNGISKGDFTNWGVTQRPPHFPEVAQSSLVCSRPWRNNEADPILTICFMRR